MAKGFSQGIRRAGAGLAAKKEVGIFIALLAIFLFFSLMSPFFFGLENLINVLRQVSLLGIIAMGMCLVIICGEIDLSVGSIYGASAILTGVLMISGLPIWLAMLLGLATGALCGLLNGLLITYARIPAMIVTLGTMNAVRALPELDRLSGLEVDGRLRSKAMESALKIRAGGAESDELKRLREDMDQLRASNAKLQARLSELETPARPASARAKARR